MTTWSDPDRPNDTPRPDHGQVCPSPSPEARQRHHRTWCWCAGEPEPCPDHGGPTPNEPAPYGLADWWDTAIPEGQA